MSIGEEIESAYAKLHQWIFSSETNQGFAEKRSDHPYPSSLRPEEVERFTKYLELLSLWTKRIDLVAPAPQEVLIERHLLDSWAAGMLLAQLVSLDASAAYLDIGSGAGLPGLMLSILEPERKVYLCEPREKRVTFMQNAISALGLKAAEPICCRAEELPVLEPLPGLLCSRAVGKTELLFEAAARRGLDSSFVVELLGPNWSLEADAPALEADGYKSSLNGLLPYSLFKDGPERQLAVWNVSRETSG